MRRLFTSTARGIVAGPAWSVNPTLLSGAIEGGNTTCDPGVYSGSGVVVSYQWMESATQNGTYTNMSGATSATYVNWVNSATPWKKCRVTLTDQFARTATADTSSTQLVAANPPGSLSYTVTWSLPETDADATTVETLTSQKIYWSTNPLDRQNAANSVVLSASATTYTITGLEAGTYYAWISATSAAGESEVSNPVEFVPT